MVEPARATDLLCQIVRCPEIAKARLNSGHPFQPPTSWIGHLSRARILFVGSNPNIGGAEFYPDVDWSDEDLIDFFDDAFDGRLGQIKGGVRARHADGSYGNWVRT